MKSCLLAIPLLIFCTSLFSQELLFVEMFDDDQVESRRWYDNTCVVISKKEHIPGSTGSAEFHWAKGATAPESGGAMRKLFTPSDAVYVDFWVKYSSGYIGSDQPYHPHEFLLLTTENDSFAGPAFTHLTAYIEQQEGTPMLALQDGMNIDLSKLGTDLNNITENRAVCGCNGNRPEEKTALIDCYKAGQGVYWNGKAWKADRIYFQNTPGPYDQTQWHHVTVFFRLNSLADNKAIPDGILRYWYDDHLIIERTNVVFRTARHPAMKFNQFIIAPWIGDGSPVDQTFWIDNLIVSTGTAVPNVDKNIPGEP